MRIISWNVNGLRSLLKSGHWPWLLEDSPDIFCLQETKASHDQLPDEIKSPEGYFSYFASSEEKKGYSGVAIYSKTKPEKVEYGMGIEEFDKEGRLLVAHYPDFVLLNVYFPNGGQGAHRLKYKMDFYDSFLEFIEGLRKSGKNVVFCGDVNTAHEEVDLARPKENSDRTGFLPEERAWIDEVINLGYVDTFRYLNPNAKDRYTYWDLKTRARDRNVGWRIDYFFVSPSLVNKIVGSEIKDEVFGSDHCPISLELDI